MMRMVLSLDTLWRLCMWTTSCLQVQPRLQKHVAKALGAVVPTKTTGLITPEEGGSFSFIGRVITRERNGPGIFLGVDPQYLNTTFEEYGIAKGSENVPVDYQLVCANSNGQAIAHHARQWRAVALEATGGIADQVGTDMVSKPS